MEHDLHLTDLHRLILHNAEKIRQLNARVKTTFKERDKSAKKREEWSEACRIFHSSYDSLAFPGGWDAIERIKTGDQNAIEAALCYLECRPYFFRSGYTFQKILKRVKKAQLSEQQALRLKKVIEKRDAWRRSLPDRLRTQAEQGDRAAQRKLGQLYSFGYKYDIDFKKNATEAIKLYRKAAEQGDAKAQRELGGNYSYGWGVPQDWAESYFWFCLAVKYEEDGLLKRLYEEYKQRALTKLTAEQRIAVDRRVEEWQPHAII